MFLKGTSVSSGKSLGYILKKREVEVVEQELSTNTEAELEKYHKAKEKSIKQLQDLYHKASESLDPETADIFQGHEMLIDDLDFTELIEKNIKENKHTAKYSVYISSHQMRDLFLQMESDYMKERAADITDISNRLIMNMQEDNFEFIIDKDKKYIFMGEEIFASDTLKIDKANLAGFITRKGSYSAHSGILARTLNIPSIIGVEIENLNNGMYCLLDADNGKVYLNPTDEQIEAYQEYVLEKEKSLKVYNKYKNYEICVNDKVIEICGNIGNDTEANEVIENGGDGIGLFRSEFLFIQGDRPPTEEEQFNSYKSALISANGKRVVVRTTDIGSDKKASYLDIPDEDNPALGLRGVRVSFKFPEILNTQLRALIRASAFGKLAIMIPMIISVSEIVKIKELIAEIKSEFDANNIKYAEDFEVGVMIETPASVIICDDLAKEVDFFSIGTNDLTQYTLAVDRLNESVADLYDYNHDAINLMISHVVKVGHKNGIWVGVCGESASNLDLALKYIQMGVDEISITPCNIPKMKYDICNNYNITLD